MICMYIYTYQTTIYLYIQNIYFSDTYCIWLVFSLYHLSHVVFFRAVWHHITSQSQQVMYYTSQLIWTLGQLAPWRKIRETCETDIHTRRIYMYVYVYIFIFDKLITCFKLNNCRCLKPIHWRVFYYLVKRLRPIHQFHTSF